MSDYISRDALLNSTSVLAVYSANEDIVSYGVSFDTIRDFPAADVAPVRQGQWKMSSKRPATIICSECNAGFDVWKHDGKDFKYCPHCGAMMDGKERR